MRAIIIEDEFLAAIHLEHALESLQVKTLGVAQDMEGALKLAREKPDLALVDLNLRDGFTGPKIAAKLAADGISVLFVTANPAQLDGVEHPPSPVLEKPLEEERLAKVIELMRNRQDGQQPSTRH